MNPPAQYPPELRQAYNRERLRDSIQHAKIGCVLVMVLMPAGYVIDRWGLYEDHAGYFFLLRLLSAALAGLFLASLHLPGLSPLQSRILSTGWYIAPCLSIALMIARVEDGLTSPYYAGMSVVMLGTSTVIQASFLESLLAVGVIILLYIGGCVGAYLNYGWPSPNPTEVGQYLVIHGYFLGCTAVLVVVGNFLYNRLRFREFVLRYELTESRTKLEESHRKLLELDQLKSRFFANVSHELRTPLTLLLAPLELLIRQTRSPESEETRGLLATMHGNALRLLKLINDLLDLVRLEAGRMDVHPEPVDLHAFLHGLASAARQVADDKQISLVTQVDAAAGVILADRDKLEKILLNLLFNALKFTPERGRVELAATRLNGRVSLCVRDTGIGIAPEDLPRVFERFWQAEGAPKSKLRGLGIGLALVKELTEMQGGRVSVSSELGKGTCFTVDLPAPEPPTPAPLPTPAPPAQPGHPDPGSEREGEAPPEEWLASLFRRAELFPAVASLPAEKGAVREAGDTDRPLILVADDEPDMLRFLQSQLQGTYRVIGASNGSEAVHRAVDHRPDLIILDMMMPEMDGLEACWEIRRQKLTASIPIVLLTARADEDTKIATLNAGASDFLTKPFSTSELQVRVRNLIGTHQLQQQLRRKNQLLESTIAQLTDTEVQLVQAEKMASLGRMSAGIIHEINNPLNFATTALYSLRSSARQLPADSQATFRETLADIDEGLDRVKNIVADLRAFAHPGGGVGEVDLRQTTETALRLVSQAARDSVAVHLDIPERLVVEANHNKLVQVLVNLLHNAVDAMHSKRFPEGQVPEIRIRATEEPGSCVLRVRDNGPGIDPRIVDKIFEPFFTTKDVGKGMGLGLSISYRILQELGGSLTVETEPGQFAEFILRFPTRTQPIALEPALDSPDAQHGTPV